MDTKEITVSDLAREQIRNAERLFPLIREKTEERKEKKTIISVSGGSGVGKTGMAFLLQNMFEKQYLQTVPQSVKAAWQETLEETGFNPFQTDVTSILTQLSVEQDFLTGGDDNIFGETKESCLAAIDKVLERIENPLAAVTEERAAYLQQEKEFYTVLESKIRE